jgi:hypothetical protein
VLKHATHIFSFAKYDASVKSILPPQFWSVGIVFAVFFGLLTVASNYELLHIAKVLQNIKGLPTYLPTAL